MDQFQCCHLTKAMIPTNYIEHHLQIVHMVTVVLLLLQVLLSIFSMHTFQLLFLVSLFVVPLRQVLCLFHPFFLYDLSHAERAETTNSPQFLSLTWHSGELSCQRDRPVLPEILDDSLLIRCLYTIYILLYSLLVRMQFVGVLVQLLVCFSWNSGHLPYGQQKCCRFINAVLQRKRS